MLWVLIDLSQREGSIKHTKHKFELMGKKIFTNITLKILLIWTYVGRVSRWLFILIFLEKICCGYSLEASQ